MALRDCWGVAELVGDGRDRQVGFVEHGANRFLIRSRVTASGGRLIAPGARVSAWAADGDGDVAAFDQALGDVMKPQVHWLAWARPRTRRWRAHGLDAAAPRQGRIKKACHAVRNTQTALSPSP